MTTHANIADVFRYLCLQTHIDDTDILVTACRIV